MDFLTGMAYWGILVLVLANALFVLRMKITIDEEVDKRAKAERRR